MSASDGQRVARLHRVAPNGESGGPARRGLTDEELRLVRATLMRPKGREPSEEELVLFRRQIERTGLDPFNRQIYVVYRWNRGRGCEEMSIETTIDGLRLIAERTGRYEGQTRVYWCGEDGSWRESWPAAEPPVAATVGVYKSGAREPTWGTAHFCEYAEFWEDSGKPKGFYGTMPRNQLGIRAEALALRKAFPAELSGLYVDAEMAQADAEAARAEAAALVARAEELTASRRDGAGDDDRPEPEPDGERRGGMRPVEVDRSAAPAQLRKPLREAIEAAGVSREAVRALSKLCFDDDRAERLTAEQMAELTELVGAIERGGIAEETLKGQLGKAEQQPDRAEARALVRRWIVRRATEASGAEEAAGQEGGRP